MKVHVIRDTSFSAEQYEQVMQELEATSGLISFIKQSPNLSAVEPEELSAVAEGALLVDQSGELIEEENLTKVYDWDYFFSQCESYRQACNLPDDDFVILLTPKHNALWYLAAFEDDARNVFVKTSEWGAYLECETIYPIAYTVMSQVLGKLYFNNMERRSGEGHQSAEGCMNDFCRHKKEMIFKFRTADICVDCIKGMLAVGIPQEYFLQAFSLFEKVRNEMLFKQRHKFNVAQRKIYITRSASGGQGITVNLPEINRGISLNPKESALYLFYLTEKEGVRYADLHYDRHRGKLLALYREFCEGSTKGNDEQVKGVIDTLVTNQKNRDSDLSKMRDKFKAVLGEEAAKLYYINGLSKDRDLKKGIRLDRNLISYDDTVKRHILGEYYLTDSSSVQ